MANKTEKIEDLQSEDLDFWNELDEHQKQEIKKGIAELEAGEKYDYKKVISQYC